MRHATVTFVVTVVSIWCLALAAWGGGMDIAGVGAKAKAMGGSFRAIADDWSAAYYNPAGLFYVTENQLTFNEVITHYRVTYTPNVTNGGYNAGFFPGDIHNRYEILTNPTLGGFARLPIAGKDLVAGLAIFQPFDQNIAWQLFQPMNNDASLPGQQIEHNLDALAINLVAAAELKENQLSVGISAGVLKTDLIYGGFFLRPNPASPSASYYDQVASRPNELITEWQHSDGYGVAPNLRAGLLYKATPKLNLGVSYAFASTITVDGESYFYHYMPDNFYYHQRTDVQSYPDSMNNILSSGAVFQSVADFKTEIDLPAQLGGGVAYQVNDRLLLAADLQYTFWSTFKGYTFDYEFTDTLLSRNTALNQWMVQDMNLPVDWKNAVRGSIGFQYGLRDGLFLRGGYAADQSPVKENILHPAFFDPGFKHSLNLGLGLMFESVKIDLSTEYVKYPETVNDNAAYLAGETSAATGSMPGTYGGSAFESVVQFTVRF
jgi:long-chain fatty acid transport protein